MNKKGITLIVLIVTIIIALLLALISITIITEDNLVDKVYLTKDDEQILEAKETIRAVTNQVLGMTEYNNVIELVDRIEIELCDIKGLETTTISSYGDDYKVSMPGGIELTFEEATGKKLPLYIDSYLTRTELEGR